MDDQDESKKQFVNQDVSSSSTGGGFDQSSWINDSTNCFFGTGSDHRESIILSEFGWNYLQSGEPNRLQTTTQTDVSVMDFKDHRHQIEVLDQDFDLSGFLPENSSSNNSCSNQSVLSTAVEKSSGADASTSNNPSVSSSSSDEQPEKSTGSDGKPPHKP